MEKKWKKWQFSIRGKSIKIVRQNKFSYLKPRPMFMVMNLCFLVEICLGNKTTELNSEAQHPHSGWNLELRSWPPFARTYPTRGPMYEGKWGYKEYCSYSFTTIHRLFHNIPKSVVYNRTVCEHLCILTPWFTTYQLTFIQRYFQYQRYFRM